MHKELAPGNVSYEGKTYRYQPGFVPMFKHEVGRMLTALNQLKGVDNAVLHPV